MRKLLLALLLVIGCVCPAAATPAANQLVRCADLVAAVGAGAFTWSGAAQTCANGNLIVTRTYFVTYISNTGSCAGGSTYTPTYGDMLNCKSGGSASQQSLAVSAAGSSTYTNIHGSCVQIGASTMVFSTGSAVAPTSVGTEIGFLPASSSQSYTWTIKNPSGTTVLTGTGNGASGGNSYNNSGATSGVYTLVISGLTNVTCPTIGAGGTMTGHFTWYQ